jgi:hypothetical protein
MLSNKGYAVPDPEKRFASGRAEATSSFSQKICTKCKFFVKKKNSTMLPQAKLAFRSDTRPELAAPRNSWK